MRKRTSATRRRITARCVKEARRFYHLTQLRDALNRIGTVMYRGSLKYTLIMSIATSVGRELPKVGLPGLNDILAIVLPLLVFVTAFGGGLALRYIPSLISLGHITTAEAADFNLMKDYRRAEIEEHLEIIWQRVFRYEADIRYTENEVVAEQQTHCRHIPRVRNMIMEMDEDLLHYLGAGPEKSPAERSEAVEDLVEGLLCARPQCPLLEKTERAFVTSTTHALRQNLEQEEQTRRIGFDISQWEDWRDSAYFHPHDRHLTQQFDGNPALQAAKRQAGWDRWDALRQAPTKFWQHTWFRLITRAISVHLGTAVNELNSEYPVEMVGRRIRAQIIMWPGAEREALWLCDVPGRKLKRGPLRRLAAFFLLREPDLPRPAAELWENIGATLALADRSGFENPREEILARRCHIIRSRFGPGFQDARELIDRCYLGSFKLATDLRIDYDAQYAAGMLEQTPAGDYEAVDAPERKIDRLRRETSEVREELDGFLRRATEVDRCLEEDQEARRAVAVAFHTDRDGVKERHRDGSLGEKALDRWMQGVMEERKCYTHRLEEVRMHQTLSLIQVQGARRYIRRLAYTECEGEA